MKTNFTKPLGLIFAAAAMTLSLPTLADTEIVPLSYSFDRDTDCGSWCYHDTFGAGVRTGTTLTDGIYGPEGWAVHAGWEWLGWVNDRTVNIDFDLGSVKHVDTIKVGSTQDNLIDVVLPNVDVYKKVGSSWSLVGTLVTPESVANNRSAYSTAPHGFLTLSNLNIDSQFVRVSLTHNIDGPWTFADEVDFYASAAPVPEPETYAMLLAGLGLMGLVSRRRTRARNA